VAQVVELSPDFKTAKNQKNCKKKKERKFPKTKKQKKWVALESKQNSS
jgi:hypothetical protein